MKDTRRIFFRTLILLGLLCESFISGSQNIEYYTPLRQGYMPNHNLLDDHLLIYNEDLYGMDFPVSLFNANTGKVVWTKNVCQCYFNGIRGSVKVSDTSAVHFGFYGEIYVSDQNFNNAALVDTINAKNFNITTITSFREKNNQVLLSGKAEKDGVSHPYEIVLNPSTNTIIYESLKTDTTLNKRYFFMEDFTDIVAFKSDTLLLVQLRDSSQVPIWTREYEYDYRTMSLDQDRNIYFVESVIDSTNGVRSTFRKLIKISKTGEFLWESDTIPFMINSSNRLSSIGQVVSLSDGSVLALAGEYHPFPYYGGRTASKLVRFDSLGKFSWQFDIKHNGRNLYLLENGEVLIVGVDDPNDRPQPFVMKISDLTVSTSEIENRRGVLNLYPNPTNNMLNFSLSDNLAIESIKVFDSKGRLVLNSRINGSVLNVSALPTGTYFAIVSINGNILIKKFLKF